MFENDEIKDEDILLFDEGEDNNMSDFLENPDGEKDDTDLLGDEAQKETSQPSNQQVNAPGGLGGVSGQHVNRGGVQTDVDLVFVIDLTGSMEPLLSMVKNSAKTLYTDIIAGLGAKGRQVHQMRIKVIGYRDHYFDWADPTHPPIQESPFFMLPDQGEQYTAFVDGLEYAGGEDEPESALEALHLAFNSEWQNDPNITKKRQVVLLFTDASAHPLNDPMRYDPEYNSQYPEGMPESLEALENEYMSPDVFPATETGYTNGHRLIMFAPENMYPWNVVKDWDAAQCQSMDPEKGLEGLDMDAVIAMISGSM